MRIQWYRRAAQLTAAVTALAATAAAPAQAAAPPPSCARSAKIQGAASATETPATALIREDLMTFTVTPTSSPCAFPDTLEYTIEIWYGNARADDIEVLTHTLTWDRYDYTPREVRIRAVDDHLDEPKEEFQVMVCRTAGRGAELQATGTVLDDDGRDLPDVVPAYNYEFVCRQ